jgi:hypothetical protein
MTFTNIGKTDDNPNRRIACCANDVTLAVSAGGEKAWSWDDFTDWADRSGISDAITEVVRVGVNRGTNEIIGAIGSDRVGQRVMDGRTGQYGIIRVDPSNPTRYVIAYENGTTSAYNGQPLVAPASQNNLPLYLGIGAAALAVILLIK